MNYLQMENKPQKGDTVFAIDESFSCHNTRPTITIYPRIVQSITENGAFFQTRPEFEYFEFLFPTEKDAWEFINNNND